MEETECPQSVWNLIVEHVPESELPEIRVLLGDALIDIYTEMYSEVRTNTSLQWLITEHEHCSKHLNLGRNQQ